MLHELKTSTVSFATILAGRKRYDVRRFDRPFNVGDDLLFREWAQAIGYTGASLRAAIVQITPPGDWGLPPDVGVIGIRLPLEDRQDRRRTLLAEALKRYGKHTAGCPGADACWCGLREVIDGAVTGMPVCDRCGWARIDCSCHPL